MQIEFSGLGSLFLVWSICICAEYVLCMYECVCGYCKLRQLKAPHKARYMCEAINKRSARYFLFCLLLFS